MPSSHEHRKRMLDHLKEQQREARTDNSKTVRWEITDAGRAALAEFEGK